MSGCYTIAIPPPLVPDAASFGLLLEGIRQLGFAIHELKQFEAERGKLCACECVVKTLDGVAMGVTRDEKGQVSFLVAEGSKAEQKKAEETVKKIKQVYARLQVLSELKKKGYKNVKEEKLADGSIRLVLQKWQ